MNSTPSPSNWVKLMHNLDIEGTAQQSKDNYVCVCAYMCIFLPPHEPKTNIHLLRALWKLISKESEEKPGWKCYGWKAATLSYSFRRGVFYEVNILFEVYTKKNTHILNNSGNLQ